MSESPVYKHSMTRAPCAVCLRQMPLRKDGTICVHGPVSRRCGGLGGSPSTIALETREAPDPGSANHVPSASCTLLPPSVASFSPLPHVRVLKRLPRASRDPIMRKLASIMKEVATVNSSHSWLCLLHFPRRCLGTPRRGDLRWSLAKRINQQLAEESDPSPLPAYQPLLSRRPGQGHSAFQEPLQFLASRVSEKLEKGDFRGAVRLACSEDSVAREGEASIAALKAKHPDPHPDTKCPQPPSVEASEAALVMRESDVAWAILSFPKGSAGGPDGLRPQHLQDMTSTLAGAGGPMLIRALTAITNLVLTGAILEQIHQLFFSASLTALTKKDGGICPIAVGCTLRRIVAKTASRSVMQRMGSLLAPLQLGYGTPLGAEAAAHSARLDLSNLPSDQVLLKLDLKNAFNSVRRDKMLEAIEEFAPELFPYLFSCYSSPSSLYFNDTVIRSSEGVQQGDPLGPLLFCLVIHPLILQLKSEF